MCDICITQVYFEGNGNIKGKIERANLFKNSSKE